MKKEREYDFEEMMTMKEKRRMSRAKSKRNYEKTMNSKTKFRNMKKVNYASLYDDDYDDYYNY